MGLISRVSSRTYRFRCNMASSFFSSPEQAETPECVRVAKERYHEFMNQTSETSIFTQNKKRRRSFVERSNSIIANTTRLSDHNVDELIDDLNKSKADLEKSEKEREKAVLARDLLEDTL